jgi:hypothetical protein
MTDTTKQVELSANERQFIRHALGLNSPDARGVGYRNRYYTIGPVTELTGDALVAKGLAVRFSSNRDGALFVIRLAGFIAVFKSGECMDREELQFMNRLEATHE